MADAPQRTAQPAGYVLISGVSCFLVWLLLFAAPLQHNAQGGPLGGRRTVALDVLGPIAALSRVLHLADLNDATEEALGRQSGGGADVEGPLPSPPPPSSNPKGGGDGIGTPKPGAPVLPKPTKSHPLSVLVVGDSLAIGLGTLLSSTLANTGVFKLYMDARISTGLSRPDYFNWPVQIRYDIARFNPDIVVINLGGNDPQPLLAAGHGVQVNTPEWLELYGERVDLMIQEAAAGGRQVVWVGLPISSHANFNWAYKRQNTVYRSTVERHPGVATYIDVWALFQNSQGGYAPYLQDASGQLVLMRAADGVHMTPAGYKRMANYVFGEMKPLWKKTAGATPVGATPAPSATGSPSATPPAGSP